MSNLSRCGPRLRLLLGGGVSKILLGSLIGQGTLLAVSPILTRIYTPSDFAALTILTALATIAGAFVTLSWERAITIPSNEHEARSLLALGVLTVTCLGVVILVLGFFLGSFIDRWFATHVFAEAWWLLPSTVVVMGYFSLISSWLVRQRKYGKLATRNAMLGTVQAVSTVTLGVAGAGPLGLLSGLGLGRAVSLIGIVSWTSNPAVQKQSLRQLIRVAKRFRRFPLIATWSRVLNVLGLQLTPILIVALFGSWEAGLYALTIRVLAAPVGVIADAVSQYFEGVFSARAREGSSQLSTIVCQISKRLLFISIIPAMLIIFFGPSLFALIFGEDWRSAGRFAQVAVYFYAAQFVVSPISRVLLILEKQLTQFVWDSSRLVLGSSAILIPALLGADLFVALVAYAGTQVFVYSLLWIACFRAARQRETQNLVHDAN